MAAAAVTVPPPIPSLISSPSLRTGRGALKTSSSSPFFGGYPSLRCPLPSSPSTQLLPVANSSRLRGFMVACLPSSSSSAPKSVTAVSTKLYVSGLSFRTTEESLRKAFENFGRLVEVNLVMDRIANRPRGFAFLRYATQEESERAIEGMHGKFLDGRVIFVEVAKPRSEMRQGLKQNPKQY